MKCLLKLLQEIYRCINIAKEVFDGINPQVLKEIKSWINQSFLGFLGFDFIDFCRDSVQINLNFL